MFFKQIEREGISHYSYMVGDGAVLAVIDPVRDIGIYMSEARKAGMKIKHIFETHRNEDYVSGSMELGEKTGANIYISAYEDLGHVYGEEIEEGFEVEMGDLRLQALHTPGHTLGHLSYVLYEKGKESPYMVFTGDCLFIGDVGRSDFYGKDKLEKMTGLLYDSIFKKILPLGDEVLVFPAHGAGSACGETMEERAFSTLGYERKFSQVLQYQTKEAFIDSFARKRIKPRYFDTMEVVNIKGAPYLGEEVQLNVLTIEEFDSVKEDVLMIDIRSKEAFSGGHIPGSIYMSKKSISTFLGAIFEPDRKILFITEENIKDLEEIYWYCRRIGFDNIVGYLPNASRQWEQSGRVLEKVSTISAKTCVQESIDREHIFLDVRKKEEIAMECVGKNRINIPLQNIYQGLCKLEKNLPIYLLCNSGERATIAFSYLKAKGFNPIVISGGMGMIETLTSK